MGNGPRESRDPSGMTDDASKANKKTSLKAPPPPNNSYRIPNTSLWFPVIVDDVQRVRPSTERARPGVVNVAIYTSNDHRHIPDIANSRNFRSQAEKHVDADVVVGVARPEEIPIVLEWIYYVYGPIDRLDIIGHGDKMNQRIGMRPVQ